MQYVINSNNRNVLAEIMASSFRIAGLTSSHNIFYIANLVGSPVLVAVRRLTVQMDSTAVLATVAPSFFTYMTSTMPTGGTDCTKHLFDSLDVANANVVARGAASAEGVASAITWSGPAGTPGWRQFAQRMQTTTTTGAQVLTRDELQLPLVVEEDPKILRAGQALMVRVDSAAQTTMHYTLNAMWEEFTLP